MWPENADLINQMWQLYNSKDHAKIDRFFEALTSTFDGEALEECIYKGWDGNNEQH